MALLSTRRRKAYLERVNLWAGEKSAWRPVRMLGGGSYGWTTHLRYTGDSPTIPQDLVVKQGRLGSLARESRFLHMFTQQQAKHIPKLYKACVREGGTGTTGPDGFDPYPFDSQGVYKPSREVERFYMEYCSGGDLAARLRTPDWSNEKYWIPEEILWRIVECAARGMMMLQTGTEEPGQPPWKERPVVHFDLKPANGMSPLAPEMLLLEGLMDMAVLIGEYDNNQHRRVPISKVRSGGGYKPQGPTNRSIVGGLWAVASGAHAPG